MRYLKDLVYKVGFSKVKIYSITGELMAMYKMSSLNLITLSVKDFENGVYVIEVLGDNGELSNTMLIVAK